MAQVNLVNGALAQRRFEALERAGRFLVGKGGRALSDRELFACSRGAVAGWTLKFKGEDLFVTADKNFPFSPPAISIGKGHPRWLGAHIEGSGKLCLAPPHASYSQGAVEALMETLLEDAVALLSADETDTVFGDEFLNYWSRDMSPSDPCLSLLELKGPTRGVFAWHGKLYSVFAETEEELKDWLRKKLGGKVPKTIVSEPFMWFDGPLTPAHFPKRAKDVLSLADMRANEAVPHLVEAVARPIHRILFGFETTNGPALGGFELSHPPNFTRGFRTHRMPQDVALSRFYGGSKLKACFGQRVDHGWIHTRAGEQSNSSLKDNRVILVGCGSLGSGVAMLLAKSGVGNLMLVDDELLGWDNIARHTLGASKVQRSKAAALAEVINQDMPSVSADAVDLKWQTGIERQKLDFYDSDLVITTTADWTSDSMLNFKARTESRFPPLLFGWLEPHALAGSGLLVADLGGCYACGANETGVFTGRLTDWPDGGEMKRLPACGGHYQPYGPVNLGIVQSMIANLALDVLHRKVCRSERRSWVSSKSQVEAAGGSLSATAEEKFPAEGGFKTEPWKKSPVCELCG